MKIIAQVLAEGVSRHGEEEPAIAKKNTQVNVSGMKRMLFANVARNSWIVSLMSTSVTANVNPACTAVFVMVRNSRAQLGISSTITSRSVLTALPV